MTIRYSTALRDYLQETGSFKSAFQNGVILLYSGSQPASANDAPGGSLLATISSSSGAVTSEVKSQGSVTFSGTIGGSISSITVNSIEILGSTITPVTDVTATAVLVAAAINNNPKNWLFTATSALGVVTITAKPGMGTLPNGWVVSTTVATITKSDVNMGSVTAGVLAANGLRFGDSATGALVKDSSQTWSGVGTAAASTGTTAGWFRLCGSIADAQAADSAGAYLRLDGSIATSGADMNVSSATIVQSATFTINNFTPTEPGTA